MAAAHYTQPTVAGEDQAAARLEFSRTSQAVARQEDCVRTLRTKVGKELDLYTPHAASVDVLYENCTDELNKIDKIVSVLSAALGSEENALTEAIEALSDSVGYLADECRDRRPVMRVADLPLDMQEFIRANVEPVVQQGWFAVDTPPEAIMDFVRARAVEIKQPLDEANAVLKLLKEEHSRAAYAVCGEKPVSLKAGGSRRELAKGGQLPDPAKARNTWLFVRMCYIARPSWRKPLLDLVSSELTPDMLPEFLEGLEEARARAEPSPSRPNYPGKIFVNEIKHIWSSATPKMKAKLKVLYDTWREETGYNFPLPDFPDEWRVKDAEDAEDAAAAPDSDAET